MTVERSDEPLVSVIVIFLNEETHLAEAIDSVRAQTHEAWELILVDDGSTDASSAMAKQIAADHSGRIMYLEHPGHENLGMSQSRNIGVDAAGGHYIAYLDADDMWLPQKLERQLMLMADEPEARIVYGPLHRWFSWSSDPADTGRDDLYGIHGDGLTLEVNRLYRPPELVALFLEHKDLVPSGALFERDLFIEVGGAEPSFHGDYEDAVVFVKMCLRAAAYCADDSWYLYRQHSNRSWSDADHSPRRLRFLDWTAEYLEQEDLGHPMLERALRRGRRKITNPHRHRIERTARRGMRLIRRTRRTAP